MKVRRPRPSDTGQLGLVILAALVLVGSVLLWHHDSEGRDTGATSTSAALVPAVPYRFSTLFVGDSFTAGTDGTGMNAYPYIVCHRLGWTCNVDGQGSTGFVNDGKAYGVTGSAKLIDRLDKDKRLYTVDLLFVDAGRNDLGFPPDEIADAVSAYFAKATSLWPNAKVVMLLPAYISPGPYDNYGELKARFEAIVASIHGTLLDPIAEGWYANVDLKTQLKPDGVHPTAHGNEFIADKIMQSLAVHRLGDLGGQH